MYFAIQDGFGANTLIAVLNGVEKTAEVFKACRVRVGDDDDPIGPNQIFKGGAPVFSTKFQEAWIGRNKGIGDGPFWNAPWGIRPNCSASHGPEQVGHSILLRRSERNCKPQPDILSYVLIAGGSVQAFSLPKEDPVIDFQSTIEDTNTVCPFAITKSKDVLLFSDDVRFPLSLLESVELAFAGSSPAEIHMQCDLPGAVHFPCKSLYAIDDATDDATDATVLSS